MKDGVVKFVVVDVKGGVKADVMKNDIAKADDLVKSVK